MRKLLFAILISAPAFVCEPAEVRPDAVPVYDATQVPFHRYTIVKRLGVEGFQSAFWISAYGDLTRARQALVNEAARLGADGVVDLQCVSRADGLLIRAGYYCYGSAIRITNERTVAK
jgi:hypothetical protein